MKIMAVYGNGMKMVVLPNIEIRKDARYACILDGLLLLQSLSPFPQAGNELRNPSVDEGGSSEDQ